MNDQRHDQAQQHKIEPGQDKTNRDLPSVGGQHERQQHADSQGKQPHGSEQKRKTKQPSHQGGSSVKSDHKQPSPVTQK